MPRRTLKEMPPLRFPHIACAVLLLGSAHATDLDFGVSLASVSALQLVPQVGLRDLSLAGGRLDASVSTLGVQGGYERSLTLPPLGAVTVGAEAGVPWGGGLRLSARVAGSAGPVALNVGGSVFTASALALDPLAGWRPEPTDLRPTGWAADLGARYRVSRALIAVAGGELGAQPNASLGIEQRRDLTRATQGVPGEAGEGETETESTGTLTLRAGVRGGQNVLGLTGGLSYASEAGPGASLDLLVGRGFGVQAALTLPEILGFSSNLYAAYEPWRAAAAPLRYGLEARRELGRGTLVLAARGGQTQAGVSGFGAEARYRFTLPGREP